MKRSKCPVCNADTAVKKDGTLVRHGRHRTDHKPDGELIGADCPGSGTEP